MKTNELCICLYGKPIGMLEQLLTGQLMFTYDINASIPISISMPIRKEPYLDNETEAFFGGLLPESDKIRKIIARRYGISPQNSFALLKAIGYDCAGAISCHATNILINDQESFPLTGRVLTQEELYTHLVELPEKPLFLDDIDGLRLSLAGAQDKAAVCLLENQIAISTQGCPTTHILKPGLSRFEGIAENEYFCMRIAKRMGLTVPDVQLRHVNEIRFIVIERYDRRITEKIITRIHQEDFCQALGIRSAQKYQNEGGPSFKDCFGLINKTSKPAIGRSRLLQAILFNYLIGNHDAHGKNFSLLHSSKDNYEFAPLYDLVCTQVYPNLSQKMAMKIGGEYQLKNCHLKHWEKLCTDIEYKFSSLKIDLCEFAEKIIIAAEQEKQALIEIGAHVPMIEKIIEVIHENAQSTIRKLGE